MHKIFLLLLRDKENTDWLTQTNTDWLTQAEVHGTSLCKTGKIGVHQQAMGALPHRCPDMAACYCVPAKGQREVRALHRFPQRRRNSYNNHAFHKDLQELNHLYLQQQYENSFWSCITISLNKICPCRNIPYQISLLGVEEASKSSLKMMFSWGMYPDFKPGKDTSLAVPASIAQ